jgi:hypothetical protein
MAQLNESSNIVRAIGLITHRPIPGVEDHAIPSNTDVSTSLGSSNRNDTSRLNHKATNHSSRLASVLSGVIPRNPRSKVQHSCETYDYASVNVQHSVHLKQFSLRTFRNSLRSPVSSSEVVETTPQRFLTKDCQTRYRDCGSCFPRDQPQLVRSFARASHFAPWLFLACS